MKTRFIVLILFLTQEKVFDLHSFGGGILVTKKGWSAVASANHCQGQLAVWDYILINIYIVRFSYVRSTVRCSCTVR